MCVLADYHKAINKLRELEEAETDVEAVLLENNISVKTRMHRNSDYVYSDFDETDDEIPVPPKPPAFTTIPKLTEVNLPVPTKTVQHNVCHCEKHQSKYKHIAKLYKYFNLFCSVN